MKRNLLNDTINFGMGLFNTSKEKIENFVEDMVDRGEVASEDSKKVIDDILSQVEKEKANLKKFVKENIKESIDLTEYVKKDEVQGIIRDELKKIFPNKE